MQRTKRYNPIPFQFEELDPRVLLSVGFAGVGLATADSDLVVAWSYAVEGTLSDSGQTLASLVDSGGPNPPVSLGPIQGVSLERLSGGRMAAELNGWLAPSRPVDDAAASSFLLESGHAIGWSYAEYAEQWAVDNEFFLFVQRPANASVIDLSGSWQFLWLGTGADKPFVVEGNASVTNSFMQFNRSAGDDNSGGDFGATITSVDADGLVHFANEPDARFYLSADKSFVIFAMGGTQSTDPAIGLMFRAVTPTEQNVVGSYRWSINDDDIIGDDLDHSGSGHANGILSVKSDNTFTIVNSSSHDDGYDDNSRSHVVRSGSWSIEAGRLVLHSVSDRGDIPTLNFVLAGDGTTLIASSGDDNGALGIATRMTPTTVTSDTGAAVATYATLGDSGHPRVFELGDDKYWRNVDLSPFGPDSLNDLASWVGEHDGRTFAVGAGEDTTLYRRDDSGAWSGRSLTELVPGSTPIVRQIEVMEDASGNVHVIGLNTQGEIVRFELSVTTSRWTFHNITRDDLASQSQQVPQFIGDLISYDTSWEGLNLAGIDAGGDIWTVWWSPGLDHWNSSNLSRITGAGSVNFTGGLTAYLTSWGGINLAGVDDHGDIEVVWWVPGGSWEVTNMTDSFGGPQLTPSSVSSYRSSWDGLNIVGFDQATGKVHVYWWAPGMNGWSISSLSDAVGASAIDPVTHLRGISGSDDSLNVIGQSSGGQVVRYYWEPQFSGSWLVENLDDSAYHVR